MDCRNPVAMDGLLTTINIEPKIINQYRPIKNQSLSAIKRSKNKVCAMHSLPFLIHNLLMLHEY